MPSAAAGDATRGLDIERVRAHVESRLHLIPVYRRRLAFTPIQGHPIWVDDHAFDVSFHVRQAAIPSPSGAEQLRDLAGHLVSQPLDMQRPPWELWFLEGLADGGFAMVAKVHHCMVDGASGVTFENSSKLEQYLASFDGPVVIHCGGGNRVGALLALRQSQKGDDDETAVAYGIKGGLTRLEPHVREVLEAGRRMGGR